MSESGSDRNRLAFLDAARGVAVVLVLIQHGVGLGYPAFAKWTEENADIGRIGVLLFLAISGFIIPQSLTDGGTNAKFWIRRFFRLYPAYWVAIGLGYAYACFHTAGLTVTVDQPGVWLLNLTMLQGFFKIPHVWHIFWTLHLELVIYLTFWVLAALRLLGKPGTVIGALLVVYLGWALISPWVFGYALILSERISYAAAWVGFAAQAYYQGKFKGWQGVVLLGGAVLAPVAVMAHNFFYVPEYVAYFWLKYYLVNFMGAYFLFFSLLALGKGRRFPILAHVGRISYSIYLIHPLVLVLVYLQGYRGVMLFLVMSALTIAVSEILFRLVESPAIALGKRLEQWLLRRRSPSPAPEALAVPVAQWQRSAA